MHVHVHGYLPLQILSADGTQQVGKITKQWSGLAKEYFTDADNFGIQCKHMYNVHVHVYMFMYKLTNS